MAGCSALVKKYMYSCTTHKPPACLPAWPPACLLAPPGVRVLYAAALDLNSDLGLDAAQYGTASGLYFLGFGLFMLPLTFISVRQRGGRSWWFGVMTSAWGVISMLHCTIQTRQQLYALRVVLGASQAAGTTSIWHLISQFYPSRARSLPMAVYVLGQVLAMMLAPPVSAGILKGMSDGLSGLRGWQWLYLVSCCLHHVRCPTPATVAP
jgi:sugar phosphate permease